MKFLVDAQLPRLLAYRLRKMGHDTLHTLDLPRGNRTTDVEINRIAQQERRILVTKDADFVNTFIVAHEPYKLLLVSTGNSSNAELDRIFIDNISVIETSVETHDFIKLNPHDVGRAQLSPVDMASKCAPRTAERRRVEARPHTQHGGSVGCPVEDDVHHPSLGHPCLGPFDQRRGVQRCTAWHDATEMRVWRDPTPRTRHPPRG